MKSHRVVWPRKGVAEIEAFDTPKPAEHEVLLRTLVTLISPGTERAFFLGLPNAAAQFPLYPGYSNIAEVEQVGSAVALPVGARVATMAGHASHVILNAADCILVPANVDDEDAVFFTLATIALQAVRKARIELGESVLVIGAGLVGLLAAQLAKLAGGVPVVCVDREEKRLQFARALGIDHVMLSGDDLPAQVQAACGSGGARVVIEASGHPTAIPTAFACTARYGRVVLLGSTRGETESVNFYRDVHHKGLTVVGAHNGTRPQHDSAPGWWTLRDDEQVILKLMELGRLTIQPMVTHRFDWQDAPAAYDLLTQTDLSALGIILDWRDDEPQLA